MNQHEPPTLLTVKDMAVLFRVNTSTVYRMLKRHEFRAFRVGRDWRFDMQHINQWMEEETAKGTIAHYGKHAAGHRRVA